MAPQSGYERRRDANRNTLASLVYDVSPDGACCCCDYLVVPVGRDGLRVLFLLVIPHAFLSIGISSSSIKWSDAPLSIIIVNLKLLALKPLLPLLLLLA